MIRHTDLGARPFERGRRLKTLLNAEKITLAGNLSLKIYGTLKCQSGKRMKFENRVFFVSETEAIALGFRPCGHCMRGAYLKWKAGL